MRIISRSLLGGRCALALLCIATICIITPGKLQAGTYYWNPSGGTGGAGGTPNGIWGSGSTWTTSSTVPAISYTTSSNDNLVFVAGAGTSSGENAYTVTVVGAQHANSLLFTSSGAATLSGTGTILTGSGGISVSQYAYGSTAQGAVNLSTQINLQAAQTWSNSSSNLLTVGGSVINGGYNLTVAGPGNTAISGVMSGNGGLIKVGSGVLTLQNANAFSGTTTISGGTLDLAQGYALQSSTFVTSTIGTLNFDPSVSTRAFSFGGLSGSANLALQTSGGSPAAIVLTVGGNNTSTTYSGVLSGAGSLATIGNGTLELIGTNTFSGGTSINGGTLQLGDGTVGHDGVLSSSGGVNDNATLAFNLNGNQTYSGIIGGIGNLVKAGTGTLTLSGSNTFSGVTSISGGTLNLSNSAALQFSALAVPTNGSIAFAPSVSGNAFVFGNLSGSGNLALQRSGGTPATIALTVGGNNFNSTYFGIASGSGSLTMIGNGTLTFTNTSTFSGGTTINNGTLQLGTGAAGQDGTLSGSGGIVNNSSLVFDYYGPQTFAANISGSGSVTMAGSNLLTLTGTNSFSGGTTISAGTLQIGSGLAGQDGLLTGSGGITNNSAMIFNIVGSQSLLASIGGSGTLTKAGSGLLALITANSYTGGTRITAGTLQLGDGTSGDDGSLAGVGGVIDNGVLAFKLSGAQIYSDVISGSGSLVKLGSGSVLLAGTNNTYGGGTTVTSGLLEASNTGALPGYGSTSKVSVGGSGTLALLVGGTGSGWSSANIGVLLAANSGGFVAGSALGLDTTGGNFTYGGTIAGSMGLTSLGPNSLILIGSNTFSGATTISGGTLQLGDGTSGHDGLLSGTGGINDNAALVYNLYGSESYAGIISGSGNLTKMGTGRLVLQGLNTFSGVTSVSSGSLVLANSGALEMSTVVVPAVGLSFDQSVSNHQFSFGALSGSGNIALQNNATTPVPISLNAGGNGSNSVYSGVLSGSGAFIKSGSGLLTLIGTNTFSGGTTISTGTLQLGNGLNGPDGSLLSSGSIANNGTLSFDLTGAQTYSGIVNGSGSVFVASGSVTLAPGALVIASSGNLHVGQLSAATLTISNSTSVSIGGELDVNYQSTVSGGTGYLNLQGGSLSVSGPVTVGHARMDTSSTDTNALVTQTGGTLSAGGQMTIGLIGEAQSIDNISGGRLTAAGGLIVGAQGNGLLNISSSGNVAITGTSAFSIGGNYLGATGGTVNLSGGTLSVGGNTILGNTGIGTLVRSGGVFSASGSLIAAGAGTLILNGLSSSVATTFGGQIANNGTGTLVIVPYNNLMTSGGNESLTFGQSSALTNGILGPWSVRETSGTNSSGDYLTLTPTGSLYSLGTASYSGSSFASSSSTSVVSVSGSNTITTDASAYVAKFGGGSTTTVNGTLALYGAGMILNGGTLGGSGLVSFAQSSSVLYGFTNWNYETGLVFAGSSTASVIAAPLMTTQGMVKFGPGTLVLSGNNSGLKGGIAVTSGVLSAQSNSALGPGGSGNDVLVAAGSELDLQGSITLPSVEVSVGGTGVGNAGGLHNISGTNSMAGVVNLTSNLQIGVDSGSLALGPIQGSYNLTKTGTGTLALSADSSLLFSGTISVLQGALSISNSGALGNTIGGGITTVSPSASLVFQGGIAIPESLVISGSGQGNGGALQNVQGDNELSGPIQLGGNTLIATSADSLTLDGMISGNYSITKTGSGTLALTNWSNNFGGLSIQAGTLSISSMNNAGSAGPLGSGTSAVSLGTSGGTATFDYAGFGDTSNRALSFAASGTAVIEVDYPTANLTLNGALTGNGTLVKTGYGVLTIGGSANYSGPTYVTQGVLAINPGGSLSNASTVSLSPGTLLELFNNGTSQLSSSTAIALNGSDVTFTGSGTVSGGALAGALILQPGENDITLGVSTTGSYVPYLKFASLAPHVVGASVVFLASGAQAQFTSASLTNGILGGFAIYNGTDFATVSGGTVQAYSAYTVGNMGTLSTSSTMNVEPTGLQTTATNAMTINSLNLVGSTGVQMAGSGALTLASGGLIANTTGGIRGGTLKGSASGELTMYLAQNIDVSSNIPNNGGPTALVISGPGTLTLTGSTSFTGDTYLNNGALVLIPPGNTIYIGAIHGPGNLTKSGTAALTLSGTSDFSGTTTITGGALVVNGTLSPNSEVTLQSSAVLSGSGTVGGDVTATGGSIGFSTGGNVLGAVTVSSGTLTVGASGFGNYITVAGGLNVTGDGVLVVSPSATIYSNVNLSTIAQSTFSGLMSGSGAVLTLDAPNGGTLTFANTAASTYGGVIVDAGTLKLATTAALGSNPLSINGGTLDLIGWSSYTLTTLGGSGGYVTKSSGSLDLIVAPPSGTTSSYGGSIVDGGGPLSLAVSGSGTLVLSGSNSFSGGTTVSSGTLVLDGASSLLSGSSLTIGGGGSPGAVFFVPSRSVAPLGQAASASVASVPEPATLSLLIAAFGVAALRSRLALRRRFGGKRNG